ncbi:TetR family transcriptional regulator [Arenicella xantha]|uniref:TetR family transcriptional regulator n=2 Tax=Arenicella xantha TaxID=644221 RepID=A0A395JJM0_9GAMM|nr:TetR family transcriptional regulator [Arenicella xantha]
MQATRELVGELGYRGLSLSSIASRAKVSRNVLYNWWNGDVSRIVEEAFLPNVREWPVPNTGSFESDIDQFLDLTIDAIHKPDVLKGFLTLAAEIVDDSAQLSQTSRYFRAPYARLIAKIVQQAEARDEICADLDPNHLAQIISGSVMQFAISKKPGRRNTKIVLSKIIQKLAQK